MPPAKSLADRIADALRSLVGEGAAELEQRLAGAVGEVAGAAGGKEGKRESAFEEAARRVGESLLDWRRGRSLLRYVQETGRDRITSVGEEVELMVKVEALFRGGLELHGRTVRFFVEGQPAGEARTDEHGVAFLPFTPETTGLHWVTYEVVSEAGRVQRSMREGECGWLQVVRDEPVAVVDADLLHDRPPEELEPLRELARRGWEVCYLDLHDEDRTEAMRETLQREALPMGALLVHPKDDRGFHALDVDFRPVLAVTSLRRLRSHGVAAVLYVCDDERAAERSAQDGVAACSLAGLRAALEDGAEIERIEGAARAFRAEQAAPGDGGFTRRLDVLTGSRLLRGNEVSLEFDNRRAREALFSAIEGAERTVHAQFYMLNDGRFADHLAARLIGRARAGVKVRLVVDSLYSGHEVMGRRNPVVETFRHEPNIEVVASDPITLEGGVDAVKLKQRDHRKIVVVDGRVAFVSGRNAGDEYYLGFDEIAVTDATPHERIPWLDASVEVRGPLVADIQRAFLANWERNGAPPPADGERVYPKLRRAGGMAARLIVHDGVADANGLAGYEAIILGARRHVYVVNDFPVIAVLSRAILRAVRRGVRVEFLTGCAMARRGDGTFFEGGLHRQVFEYMTKRRFEALMRGGVSVYEYQAPPSPNIVSRGGPIRPYVHAKVMTADGEVVSCGSANLDATASYWEREVNVVVEDRRFAEDVEWRIQEMIARSHRLDVESEYWKREAAQRAVADTLWPDAVYS